MPRAQALASQPAPSSEPGSGGPLVAQEAEALLLELRGMSERLAGQLAVLEEHVGRCVGAFRGFAALGAVATDSCGNAKAETLDEKGLTSDGAGFPDCAKARTLGEKDLASSEAGLSGGCSSPATSDAVAQTDELEE